MQGRGAHLIHHSGVNVDLGSHEGVAGLSPLLLGGVGRP